MRPATSLIRRNISSISSPAAPRLFHTCNAALKPNGASSEVGAASLSSRWLSELKATARANIKSRHQVERSKRVLDEVDARWVELLAGSEGFLSGPQWAGLSNDAVRWGDMDSMGELASLSIRRDTANTISGHVNNIMYNRFAESSRVNYFRNFGARARPELQDEWNNLLTPRGTGLILKSIKTDYKFPLVFPDSITVLHKLLTKPTSDTTSIDFEVIILSHNQQRPAARCFEDVVVYDYRTAKKAMLQPFMVDELSATYDLQEATKRKAIEEVLKLQAAIE